MNDDKIESDLTVSIKVEDIHKNIGSQSVLKGVNLEIFSGETIVLIGESGGGKSVILKHITGLMRPDTGRVIINGTDICQLKENDLATIRKKNRGIISKWCTF